MNKDHLPHTRPHFNRLTLNTLFIRRFTELAAGAEPYLRLWAADDPKYNNDFGRDE